MKKEIIDTASLQLEEVSMEEVSMMEIPLREEEEGDIIICQCIF